MSNIKVTTYSFDSSRDKHDEITQYINAITSKVKEQLKSDYTDEELKIAEITLDVCSKMLQAHFTEKAHYGKRPTD